VIITSNNEKELPDAFLRRCVFYFIEFPDVPLMHVMSAPRAAEDVSSGRRYKTQSLP